MGYGQKRVLCQQEKGNSEKNLKKIKIVLAKSKNMCYYL